MVVKAYKWADGAVLEDHSKRKHKILREYLFRYIAVRCGNPKQAKFKLALVDGFAGAGRYACGAPGSPVIMVQEIQRACIEVNTRRALQGLNPVSIDCLLLFNDSVEDVVEMLRQYCQPIVQAARDACPHLKMEVGYYCGDFDSVYPALKATIQQRGYRSVLYNLDQCGHSALPLETLADIMRSVPSVEIFYTFAVKSLLAFLSKTQPQRLEAQLQPFGLSGSSLNESDDLLSNQAWLGAAERVVFNAFRGCAEFVSPFSIHNPGGWRYWLMHFANSHRARQVYNDVLHDNASEQAHFGRSGLNMLAYNPEFDGGLYLFDSSGRSSAAAELIHDIPRFVSDVQAPMKVGEFYRQIYNATPAHSDDIHEAMISCEDLRVVTPEGGERRKAATITPEDTLRLRTQRTIFSLLR